ncbi:hypothetical protein HMPREF1870_01049 [Bacteroidales bacterium KA00344]|nr:hypothetical protein HMPREF1870_01049 [Bacteroidales bacterium KA00344]
MKKRYVIPITEVIVPKMETALLAGSPGGGDGGGPGGTGGETLAKPNSFIEDQLTDGEEWESVGW